jgi:hypothetical protein
VTHLRKWMQLCMDSGRYHLNGGILLYVNNKRITALTSIKVNQARLVCKGLLSRAGFDASSLITHGARRGGYQLCEALEVSEQDAQHMGRWMNPATAREYSGGHVAVRLRVARSLAGF